jgi:hypothetical protein
MKKMLITILVIGVLVAAITIAAHSMHLGATIRKIHGQH